MWTKIFQETRETRQAIFTIRQRGNRFSIFCCVNRVIEIILGNSPTTLLLSSLRWILVLVTLFRHYVGVIRIDNRSVPSEALVDFGQKTAN